ncbi:MFS transporter [Nocardia sp.]|nr:MFS transporter [Nocardia sp.]
MCAAVSSNVGVRSATESPDMIESTIWMVSLAKGISTLGNVAFSTGLLWVFVHEYDDVRTAGFMLAVAGVVAIVLAPGVGALLDRRRGMLLTLGADYGAAAVLLAVILSGLAHSQAGMWIAVLATSIGGTAYGPGLQMLVSRTVPNEQRRQVNARMHSAVRIGLILGPMAGGGVVAISGQVGLLVFDAATFLLSGIIITVIYYTPSVRVHVHADRGGQGFSFKDSLQFMFENRIVRWVLLVGAAVNMLTSAFAILLPVLAERISQSGIAYGILYSVYQCGMLLVAIVLSSERTTKFAAGEDSKVVAGSLALFAAGFLGAVAVQSIWLLGVSIFLIGAGLSATSLFADTRLMTSVPIDMQGRVFSVSGSILASLRPAGNAFGGLLVGVSTLLVGVIATVAAASCAVAIAVRKPLDTTPQGADR